MCLLAPIKVCHTCGVLPPFLIPLFDYVYRYLGVRRLIFIRLQLFHEAPHPSPLLHFFPAFNPPKTIEIVDGQTH